MVSGVAISVGRTGGRQREPGPEKTGYLFDMASNVLAIMVGHGHTAIYQNSTERLFLYLSMFMVYEVCFYWVWSMAIVLLGIQLNLYLYLYLSIALGHHLYFRTRPRLLVNNHWPLDRCISCAISIST